MKAIAVAYQTRFSQPLLTDVLSSVGGGNYRFLMECAINCDRPDFDQCRVDSQSVAFLLQTLEKESVVNTRTVIGFLMKHSWTYVAELCKLYAEMSDFDLRTAIGPQTRTGDALLTVIEFSVCTI